MTLKLFYSLLEFFSTDLGALKLLWKKSIFKDYLDMLITLNRIFIFK